MKKKYIVMPDEGSNTCGHMELPTREQAKDCAAEAAERQNAPYSVFERIGVARPGARPVVWEAGIIGIPLETRAALKAGTWRAVPREPDDKLLEEMSRAFRLAWWDADHNSRRDAYRAMLAAAPEKPEEK